MTPMLEGAIKSGAKISTLFQDFTVTVCLKVKHMGFKRKISFSRKTCCEKIHESGEGSKYYSCLTCIQKNIMYKNIYFCEFCIESCCYKDPETTQIYTTVNCGCSYLQCKVDINQTPCSHREGSILQKGFSCLLC